MDDSNEDRFSFGNLMCMMMHQNWITLEQREHHNKQREHQYKINAEQREHEYQLCHEEMAMRARMLMCKGSY
jgi:hypothetical protein